MEPTAKSSPHRIDREKMSLSSTAPAPSISISLLRNWNVRFDPLRNKHEAMYEDDPSEKAVTNAIDAHQNTELHICAWQPMPSRSLPWPIPSKELALSGIFHAQ